MARAVIINADDLGYEPRVSEGIVRAMTEGVVSSATLIVNGPSSEHGARLARGLPVGLHLNLVRFRSLVSGEELSEPAVARWTEEQVAREVRRQVERAEQLLGAPPTHIDVHRHAHRLPVVLQALAAVAAERGLPVRSIDEGMRQVLRGKGVRTNDVFLGDAVPGAPAYWTVEVLERTLASLPAAGVVELMCHPGLAPVEVASSYSAQREVELETFTSPRARAALAAQGVTLSSWSAA